MALFLDRCSAEVPKNPNFSPISTMVGKIYPLIEIGLTVTPNLCKARDFEALLAVAPLLFDIIIDDP